MNIKVINNSTDHAKYSFDPGTGDIEVFINPDDPATELDGFDEMMIMDTAFGSVSGQDDYELKPVMQGVAECIQKFIQTHPSVDMLLLHTSEKPGDTTAAFVEAIKKARFQKFTVYYFTTMAMASFAILNQKSDADKLTDYLKETGSLDIKRAKKV